MTTQQPQTSKAPAAPAAEKPQPLAVFSRTEREPGAITAMLKRAAAEFHLVSPATACGALAPGFSVAFSSVLVNVQADTYPTKTGDKRGLHRHVLDLIANAAAVSWDSERSRRLDDGREARYCLFVACGRYRHFDGSIIELSGTKEMDLRAGSAQIAGKSDKEVAMMRSHIVAHAETKARLRAIAAMGIRRAYTPDELKKPFVVARLQFTGQTEDPELRRQFATMQAQSFLDSKQKLYGGGPRLSLPPPTPAPPLAASRPDEDGFEPEPEPPGVETDAPAVQP